MMFKGDIKEEKATIIPPCEGYYKNISIQMLFQDADTNNFPNFVYLGTMTDDSIATAMADAVGETSVTPDLSPNGLLFKIIPVETEAGAVRKQYHYHAGSKRIYIGKDMTLKFQCIDQSTTPTYYILIQADFIPKKGAVYKKRYDLYDEIPIAEAVDFETQMFRMPMDLASTQIMVSIIANYATAPYVGEVVFRKLRSGDDEFDDTFTDALGDVLDGDYVDEMNVSFHGVVGTLRFETRSDATPLTFDTVLSLGNVNEGDTILWDINQLGETDTMSGIFQMYFTLIGRVPRQGWSEQGDWITTEESVNLNLPEYRGVMDIE